MKVSMSNSAIALFFTKEEEEQLLSKFPGASHFAFEWADTTRNLRVHPSTIAKGYASLQHPTQYTSSGGALLSWTRTSLQYGGKRLPKFAPILVETYSFNPDALVVKVPSEEIRRPPIIRKRSKSSITATNKGGAHVVLDFIQKLRYHRDALNEMRSRHPDNLTFKVKQDGSLGFEFLADE